MRKLGNLHYSTGLYSGRAVDQICIVFMWFLHERTSKTIAATILWRYVRILSKFKHEFTGRLIIIVFDYYLLILIKNYPTLLTIHYLQSSIMCEKFKKKNGSSISAPSMRHRVDVVWIYVFYLCLACIKGVLCSISYRQCF